MKTKLLLFFILFGIINTTSYSQVLCGDTFTDQGGISGDYANDTDYIVTITPTTPGEQVTVTFSSFNTEITWDALYVFDGNSIASPQIASANPAGNVPGGLAGGFWGTTIPGPFTSTSLDGSLTFRFRTDDSGVAPGWVANVTCAPTPTCLKPTNAITSFITATTVTLRWNDNASASSWEIIALPCGSAAPTASSIGTVVSSYPSVVSGLLSNTCYEIYVRAICGVGDNSLWAVSAPVTTLVGPPVCGGQFIDNGGIAANYVNGSDVTTTICPTNAGDKVTVTFVTYDTEATWDALYVFDGGVGAPQIASANPAANVPGGLAGGYWGTVIPGPFTSSSPDGCLTFRFRSDNTQNRAGWLANITCGPPPTCPKPTALAVTTITPISASVSWIETGTATSWEYILLTSGSPVPTAASVGTVVSTNLINLSGLVSNTCYTVYVRAICSGTESSDWSTGSSFCTTVAPPGCGGQFVDNGGVAANYANSSDNTYIICPDTPGDLVTVTFTTFNTEANWDALYVFDGNSLAAPQIASTNAAANVPGGLPGGYWGTVIPGPFIASSPSGCLTFRFRSDNTQNRAGWTANITCAPPPTCPKPNALVSANILVSSATIAWTENGSATEWDYLILLSGSPLPTAGSTGFVAVSSNPVTITGLAPNTCYTVYVRAVCSASDKSDWSVSTSFCTPMMPPGCGGQFVDNGGTIANYANSSDNTYVICPNNPGELVTVVFTSFNTEATWDALYVFDGNSIASPQIASTNPAANVPGGLSGGYWGSTLPGPFTSSSPDGCLTFRFRSDNSQNASGWIADITCAPDSDKFVLVAYVDQNNNGTKDLNEPLFPNGNFIYQQNNAGANIKGYSPTGQYALYDANPANTYDFSYEILPEFAAYYSGGTATYSDLNIAVGGGPHILYFPVTSSLTYNDIAISVVPLTAPRPGVTYQNKIVYRNNGTTMAAGTITFAKPPAVTVTTISQTGTVANVNGFTYAFTNLLPNETRTITVTMQVPTIPTVTFNSLLTATASVAIPTSDIDMVNNTNSNSQIVVNLLTPNDKMESHGDKIPFNTFTVDDYLYYTIRFQNDTPTTAVDLAIEDLLNAKINAETVRMVSSSHNYVMNRVDNLLRWNFKNIHLLSSFADPTSSVGYVQFKVKLNPGFVPGTLVPNSASIYFDSSPVITTNVFNIKFTQPLSNTTFDDRNLVLYPNPAKTMVQISLEDAIERINTVSFYDIVGKKVKDIYTSSSENVTVDVADLPSGVYLIELKTDTNLKLVKKLVIQ